MNHIYRLLFNRTTGICQVVSELVGAAHGVIRRGAVSKPAIPVPLYGGRPSLLSALCGLLVAPSAAWAVDYTSQVVGPATLNSGDTVTVSVGTSALSTTAANTPITVNGRVVISASGPAHGAYATGGAIDFLADVTGGASISVSGSSRYGLYAQNAGTVITASGLDVVSSGNNAAYAAYAAQAGRIVLEGGSMVSRGTGSNSYALYANAGNISATDLRVSSVPGSSGGVWVNGGGRVDLKDSEVLAGFSGGITGYAVNVNGTGSVLAMDGTDVYTGLKLDPLTGQALDINGNPTSDPSRYVTSGVGSSASDYAVYAANGGQAWINVDPVTGLPTGNSSTIRVFTVNPSSGVYASGTGTRLSMANTTLTTTGASSLTAGFGGTINATGLTVLALGGTQMIVANGNSATLNLTNSKVTSLSTTGIGLTSVNNGVLNVSDSSVRITGTGSGTPPTNNSVPTAVETYGGGKVNLTGTTLITQGAFVYGIRSWNSAAGVVDMRAGGIFTGVKLNANGDPVDSGGNATNDPAEFVASNVPGAHAVYAQAGNVYLNVDPASRLATGTTTRIVVNALVSGNAGSATNGLYAAASSAAVTASGVDLSLKGISSNATTGPRGAGLRASGGGIVSLIGDSNRIVVDGNRSLGLYADGAGSRASADNLDLTTTGTSSHGGYAQAGASLYLNTDPLNGGAVVAGSGGEWNIGGVGLLAQGAGSSITAANLHIATRASNNAAQGNFAEANGVGLVASGGSITGSGLMIDTANTGASNLTTAAGVYVNSGGQVALTGGRITAAGSQGVGVLLDGSASPGSLARYASAPVFQGIGADILGSGANGLGLYAYNGGQASLQGGSVTTTGGNSHALRVDGGALTLAGVDVLAQGAASYGLLTTTATGASTVALSGSSITTTGDDAIAVAIRGAGNAVAFDDAANRIVTSGANAHAISLQGSGVEKVFDGTSGGILPTTMEVAGAGAAVLDAQDGAQITLAGDTRLSMAMTTGADTWGGKAESGSAIHLLGQSTTGGTGLWASGASLLQLADAADASGSRIRLDDSSVLDLAGLTGTAAIGSLESDSSASRVELGGVSLSIGADNAAGNGSRVADTIYAGIVAGDSASRLTKTGAGSLTLSGTGSTVGGLDVEQGTLAFTQTGDFTVQGDYTTATGATTNIGQLNSTLAIAGAYTQAAGSTLDITLGASPDIVARSASLGGALIVHGFSDGPQPVRASDVINGQRYTMIRTLDGISGDFSNNPLDPSGVDYLLHDGAVSADGKDYDLGFRLAWTEGGQAKGTGTFTLGANTAFDIDVPLVDQAPPAAGFQSGWDGTSLTKDGEGLLLLSAANRYSGATLINAGTLRAGIADTFAGSSDIVVSTGATLDLDGHDQLANRLAGGGSILLGDARLTVRNADAADSSVFDGDISGTGGVDKVGAGTLVFGGANTYSGATRVDAGSLRAGTANAFSAASAHSVADGAMLELAGFDQTLAGLDNAGTVVFGALTSTPAAAAIRATAVGTTAAAGFAGTTLTVAGDYVGAGGTLSMRTQLGDDSSATDVLAIQGDSSGQTNLRITNAGGTGGLTDNGIRVVSVAGASEGQFVLQGRAVSGAYEYFLSQGGKADPQDGDWYLRSEWFNPNPENPDPPKPILRPEPAAYLGNQMAAVRMFQQSMHDRAGEPGMTARADDSGGAAWVRVNRRQLDAGTVGGQIGLSTNADLVQMGAERQYAIGADGRAHAGVMGGYGRAFTDGVSRLTSYHARGEAKGTNLGIYATWFQHAQAPAGLYVDSWLQYARFDNTVQGEGLRQESYGSHTWSGSVEAGYALTLHEGTQGALYLEPQAQVIHTDYRASDHREADGTLIQSRRGGGTTTRLGARLYSRPLSTRYNRVQPFAAVNWWSGGNASVIAVEGVRLRRDLSERVVEAKLGAQMELGNGWNAWGQLGVQDGSQGYRDVNGEIGVRLSW